MIKTETNATASTPVLVEVTRGDWVESRHRGSFAVVDATGRVIQAAGDIDRPTFPRSSAKPIQALPLIESGAADRYGVTSEELALACASHGGELAHTSRVAAWLERIGLGPQDLECGSHLPFDLASSQALIRAGKPPSTLHHCCSGKHTGFLCTAVAHGESHHGYIEVDHPVQRRVTRVLSDLTGLDPATAPLGIDGCGIPVYGIALRGIALGFAQLADPRDLGATRAGACRRLLDAMAAHPLLVDVTGGMTKTVMDVAGAAVRLKWGAEGVYCAALPGRGWGIALKIEDGSRRAADQAMATLLARLGCFDAEQTMALQPFLEPRIHTMAGDDVGCLRAAAAMDF